MLKSICEDENKLKRAERLGLIDHYEKVPQKEVNSGIIFLKKNKNYS